MIQSSCGCEVESFDDLIYCAIPSVSIDYDIEKLVRCVIYLSLCKNHYEEYKNANLLLLTKEKEKQWLNGEIDFKYIW